MKKILLWSSWILYLLCLVCTSFAGAASTDEALSGYWNGCVEFQGEKIPAILEFTAEKPISGRFLLSKFGISAIKDLKFEGSKIYFTVQADEPVLFEGKIESQSITGLFVKGKLSGRFSLTRLADTLVLEALMAQTVPADRKIVYFPSDPSQGFNWPYFLVLPNTNNNNMSDSRKQYLMVDINNTGVSNNFNRCCQTTYLRLLQKSEYSMRVAEDLGLPLLFPAFPRPHVAYEYAGEKNIFYTHDLDCDTTTLHLKLQNPKLREILTQSFNAHGFNVNDFKQLDLQLAAMIRRSLQYLQQNGVKAEAKVLMCGFSASGSFTSRFASLHPELVKAVASGAVLADLMLPLNQYHGAKLRYPLGTDDYQAITGKRFNLETFNSVARLYYSGDEDQNDKLGSLDCYSKRESRLMKRLWGKKKLSRIQKLIKLYGQSGGKGILILDRGIGHSYSKQMQEYIKAFFEANRDSQDPVYPLPQDREQLKYTLYQ